MGTHDVYWVTCRKCGIEDMIWVSASSYASFPETERYKNYVCPTCRAEEKSSQIETIWSKIVSVSSLFAETSEVLLDYFRENPEQMRKLPPRKFEEFVATILNRKGYEVQLTPPSHDHGVDIIAVGRSGLGVKERALVQCKRYAPHQGVGISEVQRMLGVLDDRGGTRALVVTTSYFTSPARTVEERNCWRLSLHDYEALKDWIEQLSVV